MSEIVSAIAARHAEDEAAGPFAGRRSEQSRLDRGVLLAEIARFREERLTADERAALKLSLELEWPATSEQWQAFAACLGPVCVAPANKHKVAIRGLLDRQPLPPGPEPKEVNRE